MHMKVTFIVLILSGLTQNLKLSCVVPDSLNLRHPLQNIGMTITTRRSTRNLQQASLDSYDRIQLSGDENDTERDYTLNYEKAFQKKAVACKADYKVQAEVKHGNYIFSFSAGMYELYRDELREHYERLNDDSRSGVKVTFKDCTDRSGSTVESQIRVFERIGNGCGQQKYVMNLYHTKSRVMVNGKEVSHFNAEHQRIVDKILTSEDVSFLDQELLQSIEDGLKVINCKKPTPKRQKKHQIAAAPVTCESIDPEQAPNVSVSSNLPLFENANTLVSPEGTDSSVCPSCMQITEENVFCSRCENWFHFECEQIPENERIKFGEIGHAYSCIACVFESRCEAPDDLLDSLVIESRDIQESHPLHEDNEETLVKPIVESEFKSHESTDHVPLKISPEKSWVALEGPKSSGVRNHLLNGSKQAIDQLTPVDKGPNHVSVHSRTGELSAQSLHLDQNCSVGSGDKDLVSAEGTELQGRSRASKSDAKSNTKQSKRVNKQKIKGGELEEQLTLAKSVISNLERKNGELENTNKILKMQINSLDLHAANKSPSNLSQAVSWCDLNKVDPNLQPNPTCSHEQAKQQSSFHTPNLLPPENSQSGSNVQSLNLIKDQLHNLEVEMVRSRLHNIELNLQQQRMQPFQCIPGPYPSMNVQAAFNPYIYSPPNLLPNFNTPQSSLSPFMFHNPMQPITVPFGSAFHAHYPVQLQGYPLQYNAANFGSSFPVQYDPARLQMHIPPQSYVPNYGVRPSMTDGQRNMTQMFQQVGNTARPNRVFSQNRARMGLHDNMAGRDSTVQRQKSFTDPHYKVDGQQKPSFEGEGQTISRNTSGDKYVDSKPGYDVPPEVAGDIPSVIEKQAESRDQHAPCAESVRQNILMGVDPEGRHVEVDLSHDTVRKLPYDIARSLPVNVHNLTGEQIESQDQQGSCFKDNCPGVPVVMTEERHVKNNFSYDATRKLLSDILPVNKNQTEPSNTELPGRMPSPSRALGAGERHLAIDLTDNHQTLPKESFLVNGRASQKTAEENC